METILEILNRGVEQLLGRGSGPFNTRFLIEPVIAAYLAIRAGIANARAGRPPYLWAIVTNAADRGRLVRSGLKDIGKPFAIAMAIDTVYQLVVFHAFYVVQALIVAITLCVLPYVVLRSVTTRLALRHYGRRADGKPRESGT